MRKPCQNKPYSGIFYPMLFLAFFTFVSCSGPEKDQNKIHYNKVEISGNIPFKMPDITVPVFPDNVFNVLDFGAVNDGKTKNTEAFARAVTACNKAGGGKVLIPPGKWFTGPIHLKSNVNLHVEQGAEILFSGDPEDYLPPVFTRHGGVECYNYSPLVYANNCENIAITGKGIFNGQGINWWHWAAIERPTMQNYFDAEFNGIPVKDRIYGTPDAALRPQLINLMNCTNVLLEDYTSKNSPFWNNHLAYCKNVVVRNIRLLNPHNGPNTDGINLDSSSEIYMTGIYAQVGDDGVCIKSGVNEDGWRVNKPTENVIIENCHIEFAHGGIVFGSEMSGGIKNVLVRNCVYNGTLMGIRFKSKRGRGGYIKDIWIQDIEMKNIINEAIHISMFYGASSGSSRSEKPPYFGNLNIKNITCNRARDAIIIIGLPEKYVDSINIENVEMNAKTGFNATHAKNIKLQKVSIKSSETPAFVLDNCKSVAFDSCSTKDKQATLLQLKGNGTTDISFSGLDLRALQRRVILDKNVKISLKSLLPGRKNENAIISGIFTDDRDQKTYEWVEIGNQTWMAENLAFKTDTGSWVFYNDITKDSVFFYNWATAKEVCPDGWHLPSDKEWAELKEFIAEDGYFEKVGMALKSKTGWNEDGNGIDAYDFSAVPDGYVYNYNNSYNLKGGRAVWWSADISFDDFGWFIYASSNSSVLERYYLGKRAYGYSVRCIKNK